MSGAADLPDRVGFERKALVAGQRLGAWNGDGDGFDVAAKITWLKRGEAVMADRLQGQSPAVIRVWSSAATRGVDNSWRAVDYRTGRVFGLTSPGEPTDDRAFIEFLANADGSDE